MNPSRMLRALAALAVLAFASGFATAAQADPLKDDAIHRLAHQHDPEITVALGRVYLKQIAVRAAREVLARRGREAGLEGAWQPSAPEWREAEANLLARARAVIAAKIEDPAWFYSVLSKESARVLGAEEADEIARHFATEGGREQRIVLELAVVGEMVMTNYTMTGQLLYGAADSAAEMAQLQSVWWKHEPLTARDFSRYPDAVWFAGKDPGVKYAKMLAIQGVGAIIRHFDTVAREVAEVVGEGQDEATQAIARFRAR